MADEPSQFVFMTCRPGAESALKAEVARTDAEWRPAFSRPGLVTFKVAGAKPLREEHLAERHWVFARAHGLSHGNVTGTNLREVAAQVWQLDGVADGANPITDVHVWQRDAARSEDARDAEAVTPLAQEIEAAIRAAAPADGVKLQKQEVDNRRPTHREGRVLDVVIVEPNSWCVGTHHAMTTTQRWPGGAIPVSMPEHAVSRAYAKMEEALAWSGLPIESGDECVELGCAPGGASQALLDRGLFVTGIDPAEVDPVLHEHPRFRHLRKRSKEVRRSEFIGVRWLAADMNLAPNYTLDAAEAVVKHPGVAIRGMVLTLKLAEWSLADEMPAFIARVHEWGFREVRVRQLATGGKEVCLVALKRKELRRLNRTRKDGRKKVLARGKGSGDAPRERTDPPQDELDGPHF